MANSDSPFGLRPVRYRSGAPYNGAGNWYQVASDYGTAIFRGDAVVRTGTANTAEATGPGAGKFAVGTVKQCERVTAGDTNAITGVVVGFAANPSNLSQTHIPASTGGLVLVADDPNLLFEIQADGAVPAASIGLNAVLIDTHSGNTTSGLSGTELDTTSDVPASDASNQLTIEGAVNREDNDVTLTHAKVLVSINLHTEVKDTSGVAGIA